MSDAASGVRVADLAVRYALGEDDALRELSFRVEPGELVAVTGPHAAGKSTLAYVLMGLLPHTFRADVRGIVDVAGHDPVREGPAAMAGVVGLCLQNPFNQISGARDNVFDEVAFGLENLGLPPNEIRERVEEALSRFGLRGLADRNPYECSGGEAQRLAMASVWAMAPSVLVLDEPTSQLDPKGAREVAAAVEDARRRDVAVLVLEHRPEWLAARADRIVVLREGRPVASGTPRSVYGDRGIGESDRPLPAWARLSEAACGERALVEDEAFELVRKAVPRSVPAGGPAPGAPVEAGGHGGGGSARGPEIVLEDVRFAYDPDRPVFDGLSLSLAGPGVVGVIGQNGGGKSTLLRLLLGLARPQSGRVLVNGIDTSRATAAAMARELALAFQNPDDQLFLPTVLREASYGARNLGLGQEAAETAVRDVLERLGIAHLAGKHPYDLGFGQRKLVTVAAAAAMERPILVLDEPTMAQDGESLRRLADLCLGRADAGRLVVVVSHNMEFVASVAGRVVVLARGRVVLDGPPDAVFSADEALSEAGVEPTAASRLAGRLGWRERPATVEGFARRLRGKEP